MQTKEMRSLGSGTYTFYNKAAGRYLSRSDRTLVLSAKPLPWTLKPSGKNGCWFEGFDYLYEKTFAAPAESRIPWDSRVR